MQKNCQVCGNPIFSANDYGTDSDGRLNQDFCSNCYRAGHFYSRDPIGDTDEVAGMVNGVVYPGMFAGRTGPGFLSGTGFSGGSTAGF